MQAARAVLVYVATNRPDIACVILVPNNSDLRHSWSRGRVRHRFSRHQLAVILWCSPPTVPAARRSAHLESCDMSISPDSLTAASDAFPILRSKIAGLSVNELAGKFGTPLYVYDAAKILERIEDLRAFDAIRYAQKANSSLAILDLVRRQGVLVEAVSAGEVERAARGRLHARRRSPIDHLHGRHLRPRIARTGRRQGLARQLRLARHDRSVGRARCGRAITLRLNPGFGHGHSRKTNTGGEQSKHGIWHEQLDDCLRRGSPWPFGHGPAPAHWLGNRS